MTMPPTVVVAGAGHPPGHSPWPRRGAVVAAAAALIAASILFVNRTDQAREPAGEASASQPAAVGAAPGAAAVPTDPTDPTVSASTQSGPGLTEPGIDFQFSPRVDGSFDVAERFMARSALTRATLITPSGATAGDAFDRTEPGVSGLQVDAGGQPVYDIPLGLLRSRATISLAQSTTTLTLRYRLSGTSVLSIPSSAGRALGFLRPLTASIDAGLPVQVSAGGSGALNLNCPQLAAAAQACADGNAPSLRVADGLTASKATIVVQFDLPEP